MPLQRNGPPKQRASQENPKTYMEQLTPVKRERGDDDHSTGGLPATAQNSPPINVGDGGSAQILANVATEFQKLETSYQENLRAMLGNNATLSLELEKERITAAECGKRLKAERKERAAERKALQADHLATTQRMLGGFDKDLARREGELNAEFDARMAKREEEFEASMDARDEQLKQHYMGECKKRELELTRELEPGLRQKFDAELQAQKASLDELRREALSVQKENYERVIGQLQDQKQEAFRACEQKIEALKKENEQKIERMQAEKEEGIERVRAETREAIDAIKAIEQPPSNPVTETELFSLCVLNLEQFQQASQEGAALKTKIAELEERLREASTLHKQDLEHKLKVLTDSHAEEVKGLKGELETTKFGYDTEIMAINNLHAHNQGKLADEWRAHTDKEGKRIFEEGRQARKAVEARLSDLILRVPERVEECLYQRNVRPMTELLASFGSGRVAREQQSEREEETRRLLQRFETEARDHEGTRARLREAEQRVRELEQSAVAEANKHAEQVALMHTNTLSVFSRGAQLLAPPPQQA